MFYFVYCCYRCTVHFSLLPYLILQSINIKLGWFIVLCFSRTRIYGAYYETNYLLWRVPKLYLFVVVSFRSLWCAVVPFRGAVAVGEVVNDEVLGRLDRSEVWSYIWTISFIFVCYFFLFLLLLLYFDSPLTMQSVTTLYKKVVVGRTYVFIFYEAKSNNSSMRNMENLKRTVMKIVL